MPDPKTRELLLAYAAKQTDPQKKLQAVRAVERWNKEQGRPTDASRLPPPPEF
jgi:hypothetical protein